MASFRSACTETLLIACAVTLRGAPARRPIAPM